MGASPRKPQRNSVGKVACRKCGTSILATTAKKNDGLCMPCKNGYRESIEKSKLEAIRQRELEKTDPLRKYWHVLVDRVYQPNLGYNSLAAAEKKYFAVALLEGDVFNGGFHQYFFNSSGSYYKDACAGLEEMGALQTLNLLERAKQIVFGFASVPPDTSKRRSLLQRCTNDSTSSRLEVLDQMFCKDPDNIAERSRAFALNHQLVQA